MFLGTWKRRASAWHSNPYAL
ncbi:hypothetical protein RSAG8_00575, partial [Rhizoctonia solani AG-8 WAC10335]